MTETVLKIDHIVKRYGKNEVLKDINVQIHSGEIFGIIGSSGAGKSTLLNTIIGFIPPSQGQVLFKNPHLLSYEGGDEGFQGVISHQTEVKKLFGFAAQKPSVYGKLTLLENLDLFGSLYDLSYDARSTNAKILLKLMGLWDARNHLAEKLSGGMLKRLDIACSLIHDPKVLILDEPTADLDPHLRKQMWYLIRKINSKGTTIILSSHFLDELEDLCDRVGIIHNGKMENLGTPFELKKRYNAGEAVHVSTIYGKYPEFQKELEKQKVKLKIIDMTDMGHELIIHSHKPIEVVKELVLMTKELDDPILDMRMNKPSLNEVFEHIIQKDEKESREEVTHQRSWISWFKKNKEYHHKLVEENEQLEKPAAQKDK